MRNEAARRWAVVPKVGCCLPWRQTANVGLYLAVWDALDPEHWLF